MRKVNVRDMIFYIIEKFYVLLLIGVLFSVAFGAKYYFSADDEYTMNDDTMKKLDDIQQLDEKYKEFLETDELTGISHMNSDVYYFARVSYEMSGLSIDSGLYDRIMTEMESEEFGETLIEKSNANLDVKSLRYLASVWKVDNDESTVIYYDFKTDNEDDADKVLKCAKTMIGEIGNKYLKREGKGEWNCVDEWVQEFDDGKYIEPSVELFSNDMENAKTAFDDAYGGLSEKEKICYKKYYLNEEIQINNRSLIKKTITGFIVGAICSCLLLAFVYMFNSKIKTVEEIKDVYGLSVIGVINKKKKTNKRKFLENKRYRFDDVDFVRAFLETLPEKTAIFYDDSNTEIQEIAKEISVCDSVYPLIHTNSETQKECLKYEKAVILIELNKMEHREFDREMEVCNMQGIDVAGIIAVV